MAWRGIPFAIHPIRFGRGHASISRGWKTNHINRIGVWHLVGRWYLYVRLGVRSYPRIGIAYRIEKRKREWLLKKQLWQSRQKRFRLCREFWSEVKNAKAGDRLTFEVKTQFWADVYNGAWRRDAKKMYGVNVDFVSNPLQGEM